MKFSVIIATYNREEYVYASLQSIAGQVFPEADYEIILVNNNSPDNTKQACDRFAAAHPEIPFRYFLETNKGVSYARNRGIAEAKGDILVFVDDDATVFDGYLSTIYSFFATHPTINACGGPIVPVYEVETPRWLSHYTEELLGGALYKGKKIKPFRHGKYPGGGNSAFRKGVFEKQGMFNPELGRKSGGLIGGEEKDLFDRLSRGGEPFYYIPQMGIHHHIPEKKLTLAHFNELTYSIGKSERIRTRSVSAAAYRNRIVAECVKWAASWVLLVWYTIRLAPSKGWKLIQFRWNVSKGLLGK